MRASTIVDTPWSMAESRPILLQVLMILVLLSPFAPLCLHADTANAVEKENNGTTPPAIETNKIVAVEPVSPDAKIKKRLERIMNSTDWFSQTEIRVEEGIVFITGLTVDEKYSEWLSNVANRTQDVVTVINNITVAEPPLLDFSTLLQEVQQIGPRLIRALPTVLFGGLILLGTVFFARIGSTIAANSLRQRLNPMVLSVVSRALATLIFFIGLYLVLQLAGWTGLAATVISGTGVAGIVAGIAFRDILENYLAGILISLRNPFRLNDLVDIGGYVGIVQRVTSRSTVLMDMDGNHVQIPNATVYKSIIQNFTANPNRRLSFGVGIGYDADIAFAQKVALDVLRKHPYVIDDPEPLILADAMGAATINLVVYFWYNGTTHNGLQIRSSLIRMVKIAYLENGISMPDEAREIVFPDGIPVQLTQGETMENPPKENEQQSDFSEISEQANVIISAEGEGQSEAAQIQKQGRLARNPEESPNLLEKDA